MARASSSGEITTRACPRTADVGASVRASGTLAKAGAKRFSKRRASLTVLSSGTEGPEPTSLAVPPITSLATTVSTPRGAAARARPPPLRRERCLRTTLISWIDAPESSMARVIARFVRSVIPAAVAHTSADAPPETSTSTSAFGSTVARHAWPASTLRASGSGCAARITATQAVTPIRAAAAWSSVTSVPSVVTTRQRSTATRVAGSSSRSARRKARSIAARFIAERGRRGRRRAHRTPVATRR